MIFGRKDKKDSTETPAAASVETPAPEPAPTATSAPAPAAEEQPALSEKEQQARRILGSKMVSASFGEIITILMRSQSYRHYSLSDLEWLVVPPVLAQQFVLAEARKAENDIPVPIAVALWASVSPEVDQKLAANTTGPLRLRPDEWKSGDILWLIDAVGPRKVIDGLIGNLHRQVFKGRPLKIRARDAEGKPIISIQKLPVAGEAEAAS